MLVPSETIFNRVATLRSDESPPPCLILGIIVPLILVLGCGGGNASSVSASGGNQTSGGQAASASGGASANTGSASGGYLGLGGTETFVAGSLSGGVAPTGGTRADGGNIGFTGGTSATGTSAVAVGGTNSRGGNTGMGGSSTSGAHSGGVSATGGVGIGGLPVGGKASGGNATSGGSPQTGGTRASGGFTTGDTSPIGGSKATGGSVASGGNTSVDGPASFHCVNWADPRDNYVDGLLVLSGLSSDSDTYATVQTKANAILTEFQSKLQANAIRIPINEPTVQSTWWNAYKAVVDAAVAKGMKVVIAYWAFHNGKPDDETAFKNMWQVVVTAYQSNNLVYFDIHNEPYGYSTAWNDAAATWLSNFPSVPKGRVIIAGTGYDDDVKPVGADTRFAGCILQLHIYGFWHTSWTAQQQWTSSMNSALGNYAARTLVGEWGAPMTTGTDYNVNTDGDVYRSYVRAVADVMHNNSMGSCYWPGLRNGDSYSMTTLNSSGSSPTLTVNSASGLGRLQWAWRLP